MKEDFTIFYIDDDTDDLDFFKEIVEDIDDKKAVVTLKNGNDLLNALNNPPPTPHLIYLDINMPGLNGLEILKILRESNKFNDLPVIMFSTTYDEATVQKSRELGATFYLPKTGLFDKLKKSIEHTLSINWKSFIPDDHNFLYNH